MMKNRLSCAEVQRRRGGPKKHSGVICGGIGKVVSRPLESQLFTLKTVRLMMRGVIGQCEVGIVDGSNAQPSAEKGNRAMIVVVARCALYRYRHLFGNPKVNFLVVDHPRDEDPAICEVLKLVKTGTTVWVVTGDTKPDPIMAGAQNAADRGCHVHLFTRHHNASTTGKWDGFHRACSVHAQEAGKGGTFTVHGVCEKTPKATSVSPSA